MRHIESNWIKIGVCPTTMILDKQEYSDYISTHLNLLHYTGKRLHIISADLSFEQFLKLNFKIKFTCRDKLYENIRLLDDYILTYSKYLTIDKINILKGFKKRIERDFIIFRCLSKYAIFIDPSDKKVYAVRALADRFDKFFNAFPVLCNTTIIPFKDKIIYDGFIRPKGIYFGKNITSELNELYKRAKIEKTIILKIQ